MAEPTKEDIEAVVGAATPHFAMQIRARVRALIRDLPEDHPVRSSFPEGEYLKGLLCRVF